jgi:hypothetical protein
MTATAGAIARQTELEVLTTGTYTPILTAAGGSVTVGSTGFLTGKYALFGRLCRAIIDLRVEGTGSAISGTSWRITVPFLADLSWHTANVLNAASDIIGTHQTRSGTVGQVTNGGVLLAGPSGTDTTGTAVIFYRDSSTGSLGSGEFTIPAELKAEVLYVVDPSFTLI